MRTKFMLALGVLAVIALASGSWSRNDPRSSFPGRGSISNPPAPLSTAPGPPDSIPGGPPPHPPHPSPPPSIPAVQFLGADSVAAGQTSNTRWQLGNSDHIAFTMAWTLTDGRGWPGFPKSGTVDIAPVSTQVLTVAVLAPDTAVVGVNALHMTVTLRDGSTATADGAIQISGTGP